MNIFDVELCIAGYVRIKLSPDSHNHAVVDSLSYPEQNKCPTETIIKADYIYSFTKDIDESYAVNIDDFLDDNKSFSYEKRGKIRKGYLFEIIIPQGWCIKKLNYDTSSIFFFPLYSESPKRNSIRYNFYLTDNVKLRISGVIVKDVNNIYDQLVKAEFDTKKRNRILKDTLDPKNRNTNTKQFATKIKEVSSRYGTLLKDVIEGKIKTETDFETELRIILKDPSFKLPSSTMGLFDHNDAPHQTNICEILSQSYIGDFNDISADTFRTVYREKQTKR